MAEQRKNEPKKAPKDPSMRLVALQVLLEVLEEGKYTQYVLGEALQIYGYREKQERAFLARLTEGVIERRLELDYRLESFSSVPVKKMKPVIRTILRMGAYQILYMDQVPDSAACNESVKLAQKKGFRNLSGFVNGLLRKLVREKEAGTLSFPDPEKNWEKALEVQYNIPAWILLLWRSQLGKEKTEEVAKSLQRVKATGIRVNERKVTPLLLKEELEQEKIQVIPGDYLPGAMYLTGYDSLYKIPAFAQGKFQVQDESSQLVAVAAGISPGMQVLDMCAAPGGKALHSAELVGEKGLVIARDRSLEKVEKIQENIRRMGAENVLTKVQDATLPLWEDEGKYHVVLADVPCSGLGILARKNDLKYHILEEQISELVALQRAILENAWKAVKEGGILLFSTCTINARENEENVRWLLEQGPLVADSLDPYLPEKLHSATTPLGYLQLLPGDQNADGFFLARLKKESKK